MKRFGLILVGVFILVGALVGFALIQLERTQSRLSEIIIMLNSQNEFQDSHLRAAQAMSEAMKCRGIKPVAGKDAEAYFQKHVDTAQLHNAVIIGVNSKLVFLEDGRIFVNRRLVGTDKEVVDGMRELVRSVKKK